MSISDVPPTDVLWPVSAGPVASLLDREVVEVRRTPIGGGFFLLLAAAALVLSIVYRQPVISLGVCPAAAAIAMVYLWLRPLPLRLRFSAEAIEFGPQAEPLPYGHIQEVFAPGRGRSARFAIHLLCEHDHVVLPARLSVASEDLYRFLTTRPLGERTVPAVATLFQDFLKQQLALHQPESIHVYRTRSTDGPRQLRAGWRHYPWRRFAVAVILSSVFTAGAAALMSAFGWLPLSLAGFYYASALALGLGLLFYGASLSSTATARVLKRHANATLIITPSGLALAQGDLQGELRWRELRGISTNREAGLSLRVAGATIRILDIYQWPLEHIAQTIRGHAGL
jgi:hypothetical protein